MKVEQNMTIFAGEEPDFVHVAKAGKNPEKENKERKTIFAGDLQGNQTLQERIRQRKEKARQEALKIVRDAWAADQAIDRSMDESREHIVKLQEDNLQVQGEMRDINEKRRELMEIYGVTEDTPEEMQPEEYRERVQELNDREEYNQKILGANQRDIMVENAVIRGTKQEKLKRDPQHTMVGAKEQADEVLEAASDEIIGMVMDAAKDHLDEEQEKREEQAKKIEEKKEEMEELQEKREERQEELEELIEDIPVDDMLDLEQTKDNIQQEVQNIVDKMKLVAEDIKGTMVDTNV